MRQLLRRLICCSREVSDELSLVPQSVLRYQPLIDMTNTATSALERARSIIRPNPAKDVMASGKVCASFGLTMCFNPEMALMAKRSGYSAVLLNLEHTPVTMEMASAVACACLNVG